MCTPACHDAGRPVSLEYDKLGKHEDVGGLDVYVTGTGSRGVLFVIDIFGFEFQQVRCVHSGRDLDFVQDYVSCLSKGKVRQEHAWRDAQLGHTWLVGEYIVTALKTHNRGSTNSFK